MVGDPARVSVSQLGPAWVDLYGAMQMDCVRLLPVWVRSRLRIGRPACLISRSPWLRGEEPSPCRPCPGLSAQQPAGPIKLLEGYRGSSAGRPHERSFARSHLGFSILLDTALAVRDPEARSRIHIQPWNQNSTPRSLKGSCPPRSRLLSCASHGDIDLLHSRGRRRNLVFSDRETLSHSGGANSSLIALLIRSHRQLEFAY
jgi:hypothetical protein